MEIVGKIIIRISIFRLYHHVHRSLHRHPPLFHRPLRDPRLLHPVRLPFLSSFTTSASFMNSLGFLAKIVIRIVSLIFFIRLVLVVHSPPRPRRLRHPLRPHHLFVRRHVVRQYTRGAFRNPAVAGKTPPKCVALLFGCIS